jgi:hypothetical protein
MASIVPFTLNWGIMATGHIAEREVPPTTTSLKTTKQLESLCKITRIYRD